MLRDDTAVWSASDCRAGRTLIDFRRARFTAWRMR